VARERREKQILVRKLQGTRTLVRHRLRWEDDIKIYHIETGCEIAYLTRPAEVCEHAYELVYCIFFVCVVNTKY
jgi:hypothetical protein